MKKSILMLAIAATTAMFFASSCKKSETLLTQNFTQKLSANQTYTFSLPTNTDDNWTISTEAQHTSVSFLGTDSTGKKIYQYIPTKDYTGADKVVLATVEETHTAPAAGTTPPPHAKKDCNATEYDYVINIVFDIQPN